MIDVTLCIAQYGGQVSETERRLRYDNRRVLIETERVLDPQFRSTLLTLTGAQIELLRNVVAYLNQSSTFVTEYFDTYYLTPTASEWDKLAAIVADLEETLMGFIFQDDYVCLRHKEAVGQDGGTFQAGAWRTRPVNDEQSDASNICSIASDQITLAPGTYRCIVTAAGYRVGSHQLRLRNITDAGVLLTGTSEYVYSAVPLTSRAYLSGPFVLDAQKVLEIQHRCSTSQTFVGMGYHANFGDEVYLIAEFWRMAIP